jgi:hypoxia up-regulated 1
MAPPGRRKGVSSGLLVLLAFLLFSTSVSAASAVLGIDLGTEYIKAAIAKPGSPIDVVLTKDSKRKEAASLAFKPSRAQSTDPEAFPERLYGGDALALSARYPGDVYCNLKTLLGLSADSDFVVDYTKRYPGLVVESVSRGDQENQNSVGFKSQTAGAKTDVFMVEELLAMELKNIKANAEAAVAKGTFVTDAVITIPPFYTAEEKRAVELAADLAGIRVLGLITDGLAVGLNFATNKVFESITDGARPEYHLVYDMGAGSTTATVLKFQGRTIKGPLKRNQTIREVQVLGTGHDRYLGGDSLNDVVLADMIDHIIEQPKVKKLGLNATKLRGHGKSMARLWKEAERMRQILSANSAAYASFEGLYDDDLTVKYSLTREKFESITLAHAARVDGPLIKALEEAALTLSDLDSVILHGGAVRTPFVQKRLEALDGGLAKIKTNVNADEAAVMGAAFKAAAISPSFRVKDIRTHDISGSSVAMKWTTDGKERQQKLFTPLSLVGAEKQVPVKTLEDVKFEFLQIDDAEIPILAVEATNVSKSVTYLKDKHGCVSANISTVFNVRLDPSNGLPEIVSGSVSCQAETSKDGGVFDNVKGLFGFGSKKEAKQEPLDGEDDAEESETLLPASDLTSSASTISAATPTEEAKASLEETSGSSSSSSSSSKAAKANPSTVTIPLALKNVPLGMSVPPSKELPRIRQRLAEFDSSDKQAVQRSEALNTLEAFTYRARDYLDDASFIAVSSEKARKELEAQLSSASEWLYSDGVDAKLQDFKDKLKNLKSLVDPVLKRKDENGRRDNAVKMLQDGLESMDGVIKMVEASIKRVAEEAALSASSLASAASESISSATAATTDTSEGDELEDDPYSSTSSAAEAVPTEPEIPAFKSYEYSKDDLEILQEAYSSAKTWLAEKLAKQKKLGPYDDPAVLVADLELKAKQLQNSVSDMIMKSIKMQQAPPKKKSKTSSSRKSRTKTAKATSNLSESSSASKSSTTGESKKDEL